jgi:hypothetical protein
MRFIFGDYYTFVFLRILQKHQTTPSISLLTTKAISLGK